MKPGLSTAHALPAKPLAPARRQVLFPERASVSRLRTLRAQLIHQGRLTEALQVARHLVELDPGRDSYCHYGIILRESGAHTKALKVFRDALRFRDGPAYLVPEIHIHTAFTWYRLHDFKRMGEALRRAYALRPKARTDAKLYSVLGSHFVSRDYVGAMSLHRAQAGIAELFGDWKQVRLWARKAERYALKTRDSIRVAEFRAQRSRAEAALGRRRASLHAARTASSVAANIGKTRTSFAAVRHRAQRLAASEIPLLLTGESGVGKTDLAALIHRSGPRAKRPLVVAPCELLTFPASDLCGHVEGAWSGARGTSTGYCGQAKDGTLVLDRVDELPPDAQRVLVPVVEGRVRAVGSAQERKAGYRVVATCRTPERLIPELRRKLSGAVLELPPLRDRVEEIPALVRAKVGVGRITEDALALLAAQPWPGNLPELEAVLARLRSTPVIGVKAVRKALPGKPGRRAKRSAQLAAMAAALKG